MILSVFMAWNVWWYAGSYSSGCSRLRRCDSSCQCSLGRKKEGEGGRGREGGKGGREREREGEGGRGREREREGQSHISHTYHIVPVQTF